MSLMSVSPSDQLAPKRKVQRLRTGCWTCRRRGYKCDEAKPSCANCDNLNIKCEGYGIRLKWPGERTRSPTGRINNKRHRKSDELIRAADLLTEVVDASLYVPGIEAGYQHILKLEGSSPPSSASPSDCASASASAPADATQSPSPVIIKQEDSNYSYSYYRDNSQFGHEDYSDEFSRATTDEDIQYVHKGDKRRHSSKVDEVLEAKLISYFLTVVAEMLMPIEVSSINPFRDIMASYTNVGVKCAMCGISAHILSADDPSLESVATYYKVAAIQELRDSITVGTFDRDDLSVSLLLATHEALEGSFLCWRNHIAGAMRGVIESGLERSNDPEIMCLLDILEHHSALSFIVPCDDVVKTEFLQVPTKLTRTGVMVPVDNTSFTTIVRSFVHIVGDIADLASKVTPKDQPFNPDDRLWTAEHVSRKLQILLSLDLLDVSPDNLTPDAFNAAMVLKSCCFLYFWTALDKSHIDVSMSTEAHNVLSHAFHYLSCIDSSSNINSTLTWALWQIGILCDTIEDHTTVLNRLKAIVAKCSCYGPQVSGVINFLQKNWELRRTPDFFSKSRREVLAMTVQSCDQPIFV